MKKLVLTGITFGLFGLTISAQQLMNSSFETWGGITTYGSNSPENWGSLNFDDFGFPTTTSPSTTAPFHAASSVVLETRDGHAAIGIPDIVGGMLSYNFDVFAGFGTPYTSRPQSIAFQHKYAPVNNDTSFVYIYLSKWDGTQTIDIAEGFQMITGSQTDWAVFNTPLEYFSTETPDSMALVIQGSAGGWPYSIISYPAQLGTILEIDAVVVCDQFTLDFTDAVDGGNVDFTSSTTATGNGGTGSLFWDFGDGNTSTDLNPSHTYAANDTYEVSLTVTDSCGNDSTLTKNVVISTVSLFDVVKVGAKLYPNPATDVLHVVAPSEMTSIVITSIEGRKVVEMNVIGNTVDIDVSSLLPGSYHCAIYTANGVSRNSFIKR